MMRRVLFLIMLLAPLPARAFECEGPHFRGPSPQINLVHIFCGEIKRGKPDGYHTELLGPTPSVRGVRDIRPLRNGRGLYNGTVVFANGRTKFSSFYPRTCSEAQIEASIRYAVAQPPQPKQGSWGFIAASAPPEGGPAFCTGDDGRPFTIRYALASRGDVNTAFPDSPEIPR
jgi:hypothetical protein